MDVDNDGELNEPAAERLAPNCIDPEAAYAHCTILKSRSTSSTGRRPHLLLVYSLSHNGVFCDWTISVSRSQISDNVRYIKISVDNPSHSIMTLAADIFL